MRRELWVDSIDINRRVTLGFDGGKLVLDADIVESFVQRFRDVGPGLGADVSITVPSDEVPVLRRELETALNLFEALPPLVVEVEVEIYDEEEGP